MRANGLAPEKHPVLSVTENSFAPGESIWIEGEHTKVSYLRYNKKGGLERAQCFIEKGRLNVLYGPNDEGQVAMKYSGYSPTSEGCPWGSIVFVDVSEASALKVRSGENFDRDDIILRNHSRKLKVRELHVGSFVEVPSELYGKETVAKHTDNNFFIAPAKDTLVHRKTDFWAGALGTIEGFDRNENVWISFNTNGDGKVYAKFPTRRGKIIFFRTAIDVMK